MIRKNIENLGKIIITLGLILSSKQGLSEEKSQPPILSNELTEDRKQLILTNLSQLRERLKKEHNFDLTEPFSVEFHEEKNTIDITSLRGHAVTLDIKKMSESPWNDR